MTTSIYSKTSLQSALQVNSIDAVVFDATGIISGVNKAAVTQMPTLGTAVATTSGTSINFTGIPAWAKEIVVMLSGVSTNGTSPYMLQLNGEVAGYSSMTGSHNVAATALGASVVTTGLGFLPLPVEAITVQARIELTLLDSATNTWVMSAEACNVDGTAFISSSAGAKSLSAALSSIQLTTVGGVNTFDAGSMNILYS